MSMGYNLSIVQDVLLGMPSKPYIHAVPMVDALRELALKNIGVFKKTPKFPLVIVNKNYEETLPKDKVCSVWFKDVRIYVITSKTDSEFEYDKRERTVLQPLLDVLTQEVLDTIKKSCKFNLTNKGHNTQMPCVVRRRPFLLTGGPTQNNINEVVDCMEIYFEYLKVLNL